MRDWPCDACFERSCTVCGHEACPVCLDDCDHPVCIEWDEKGRGTKKHECVFGACPVCGHTGPIKGKKEEE